MREMREAARLGALRHRVTLEAPQRADDEGGGATVTWMPVVTLWAEIRPRTGREVFEADQAGGRVTHDIRVRYRAGLTPAMRFVAGSRVFDIRFAENAGERGVWLICACEETTP